MDINIPIILIAPNQDGPVSKQSRHQSVWYNLREAREGWVKNISTVAYHSAWNFTIGGALLWAWKCFWSSAPRRGHMQLGPQWGSGLGEWVPGEMPRQEPWSSSNGKRAGSPERRMGHFVWLISPLWPPAQSEVNERDIILSTWEKNVLTKCKSWRYGAWWQVGIKC